MGVARGTGLILDPDGLVLNQDGIVVAAVSGAHLSLVGSHVVGLRKAGDEMRGTIESIGTLVTPVRAEEF